MSETQLVLFREDMPEGERPKGEDGESEYRDRPDATWNGKIWTIPEDVGF